MDNFWYLFAGYTAIMVVLFIYIFRILKAQKKVQQELEELRRQKGSGGAA